MVYKQNRQRKQNDQLSLLLMIKDVRKPLLLSAVTGAGIDLLRQAIAKIANTEEEPEEGDDEDWLKEFES